MTHSRGLRAALVIAPFFYAALVPLACAPERNPLGPGEECFVAADCAPGLVCVPQRGGSRVCTNDLSQVVGRPPPEGEADTGADGPEGGGPDDSGGQDTSIPDTSMPDTSMPPPMDAAADG